LSVRTSISGKPRLLYYTLWQTQTLLHYLFAIVGEDDD
jgi:hypothetical protein